MTGNEQADCDIIRLPNAVRETIASLKAIIGDRDPAPWRKVSDGEFPEIAEDELDDRVRLQKLGSRAIATLQRSLLNGELRACFRKNGAAREIPGWAWEGAQGVENVWFHGVLALDPQLPLEWDSWSGELVYLERNSLEKWIECQTFDDDATYPEMPEPWDLTTKPDLVSKRPPPAQPFVGLSEALSWIAFRFSMNRDQLDQKAYRASTLSSDPMADLAGAVAQLTVKASGGQIALRGRYYERHSVKDSDVLTEAIDPVRLEDFSQFDILNDGLRYGQGLTWRKGNNSLDRIMQGRVDCYRAVKVSRADLLKCFPAEDDLTRALLWPIPAALPGVGPVMKLDEALALLATGKPANDLELWANNDGDIEARSPDGNLQLHRQKSLWASGVMHGALRDGTLQSFVFQADQPVLAVPRLYWEGDNPQAIRHTFNHNPMDGDPIGLPVLLGRAQLHAWLATVPAFQPQDGIRPKYEDVVEWCKTWLSLGKGSGMNKAWQAFQAEPKYQGLSRDDVFRPAWREAKLN